MWCANVVSTCFGSIRASFASFSCRVEMTSRPDVLIIYPSRSSIIRSTASLRRVPWGRFPDFLGTIRGLRPLVLLPTAFRCLHSAVPLLCPASLPRGGRPRRPGRFLSRRPRRPLSMEKTRSPRFLGDPYLHAPLSDPGGPPAPGPCDAGDAAFR
jgi:hypothetical protein